MHRAIGRAFRGTCRKFRENDCPIAAGEDVRKKKDEDTKKDFVPRKHSWEEAVTWTTGLVLGYQLTHGRRRGIVIDDCTIKASINQENSKQSTESSEKSCPFSLTPKVFNQPVLNTGSTTFSVNRRRTSSAAAVVSSIDVTPFIHDDIQESELPEIRETPTIVEDEDIVFALEPESNKERKVSRKVSKYRKPSVLERIQNNPADYGTRYGADLLSVLGAFDFLQAEAQSKSSVRNSDNYKGDNFSGGYNSKSKEEKSSPFSKDFVVEESSGERAIQLMRKGAELGSCRALYNMGVAYERLNNIVLAKEYYKRAADMGHPLAVYNCAVFALKDGHLTEGYALMKMASDFGVPEAEEFMKPARKNESMTVQFEVGRVG